jgi:hypothetical protein
MSGERLVHTGDIGNTFGSPPSTRAWSPQWGGGEDSRPSGEGKERGKNEKNRSTMLTGAQRISVSFAVDSIAYVDIVGFSILVGDGFKSRHPDNFKPSTRPKNNRY